MDIGAVLSKVLGTSPGKDGSAPLAAVDRTLGAAAALGLSIAVYRMIRHGGGGGGAASDGGDGDQPPPPRLPSLLSDLVRVAVGAILAALRMRAGRALEGEAGDDGRGAGAEWSRDDGVRDDGAELVRHRGSCHCGSVAFALMAPRNITAGDCPGKIRYPHLRTTADRFELAGGAERLSVYYVTLGQPRTPGRDCDPAGPAAGPAAAAAEPKMAAHTFCSLCGVHVLRAPDSRRDVLEVNVNCIDVDDAAAAGGTQGPTVPARVRFYRDPVMGMGAGFPAPNQWGAPPPGGEGRDVADEEEEEEEEDEADAAAKFEAAAKNVFGIEDSSQGTGATSESPSASWVHPSPTNGTSSAAADAAPSHAPHRGTGKELLFHTPSTSATSVSDMLSPGGGRPPPQAAESGELTVESSSMMDSIDEYSASASMGDGASSARASFGPGGGAGGGAGGRMDGGGWAVGGSLPPPAPAAPGVDDEALPKTPSVNTDQLKYYMKRHLTPSSSSMPNASGVEK